jgi:hypothetical protein
MEVFKFIKADKFFPVYAPEIKSYNHKMRGKNGRGNPVTFTPDEEKIIKKAIAKMLKDITAKQPVK